MTDPGGMWCLTGLNVLVELIVGYAIPGKGLALAFIKALGYNIDGQAQNFISDLKQAVYRVQLLSIFVASFVQLGILNFQIDGGIKDYCDPKNTQNLYGLYPILKWCLIGFLAAFPCIVIKRWGPRKYVKCFEPSIVIGGFLGFAPYNLTYFIPGVYVAWAFISIIIFFAVMYHEKDINWWGNEVIYESYDGQELDTSLRAPTVMFQCPFDFSVAAVTEDWRTMLVIDGRAPPLRWTP
ncbi:Oligopeptide transporter 2 [Candida viswanathii]|uniref:Oligopeptide transporter 2 n=1 Tax=Candida viswanathii TaxID=5486 RepID=A0A367XZE4_9ASCO|nr:Oligopeptide transporter 2 [Candida viswanathii]